MLVTPREWPGERVVSRGPGAQVLVRPVRVSVPVDRVVVLAEPAVLARIATAQLVGGALDSQDDVMQ